jgi:hypothetical protein
MSDNSFDKLDTFMRNHSPGLGAPTPVKNRLRMSGMIGTALVTVSLASFFIWNNLEQERLRTQTFEMLTEEMLWDATADEMSEDLAEDLDILGN